MTNKHVRLLYPCCIRAWYYYLMITFPFNSPLSQPSKQITWILFLRASLTASMIFFEFPEVDIHIRISLLFDRASTCLRKCLENHNLATALIAALLEVMAIDLRDLRSSGNLPVSLALRCSQSAALPPLPHQSSPLPLIKHSETSLRKLICQELDH